MCFGTSEHKCVTQWVIFPKTIFKTTKETGMIDAFSTCIEIFEIYGYTFIQTYDKPILPF